jgi:hypothetical protein
MEEGPMLWAWPAKGAPRRKRIGTTKGARLLSFLKFIGQLISEYGGLHDLSKRLFELTILPVPRAALQYQLPDKHWLIYSSGVWERNYFFMVK